MTESWQDEPDNPVCGVCQHAISKRSRIISTIKILLTVVVVIALIGSDSVAKIYDHPPFKYYYYGQDETVVDKLDSKLRRIVPSIETSLGVGLPRSVRIDLTLTQEHFEQLTRGRVPRWAGGVAYPQRNWIIVKAPQFFGQGVPLEVLTSHEITHILLHKAAGHHPIPRWLDEGVAQLLSGESRMGSLGRLSRAAASDQLIALPRVDQVLSFSAGNANLAYAESLSAVKLFIDRYGWETVRKILSGVRQGQHFENAFETAVGISYETWQIDWLDYARNHYRWWALLEIDRLIWVLIVLLFIVAMIVAYIRRRRQYKEWLEEEGEFDDSDPIGP
ncbi:MAG: peptidase MA family metallohydrolase [Candidatus Electryoneaceae bacterium]|nr:peptidase MA family metallohydrolase [Candidatus Electryoneaceae bacterium]